jgi:UDP-4-amino-4,6-dideoxy-N-acetyl-beta-L-altrosamine N-acetyltransferase
MYSLSDIKFRPIEVDDLSIVLKWRNSYKVRQMMVNNHIIEIEEHKKWFSNISLDKSSEWMVVEYQNNAFGVLYITDIKPTDATCTWGMYIDDKMHNSGIGVLIEFLAIERMVNKYFIRKICGHYLSSNKMIFALHQRFGFEREGVLKEHTLRNGQYDDLILIALFTSKWPKIREDMILNLGFKI